MVELQTHVAALRCVQSGAAWRFDSAGVVVECTPAVYCATAAGDSVGASNVGGATNGFLLQVTLSNGHEYGCDALVCALGVIPSGTELLPAAAVRDADLASCLAAATVAEPSGDGSDAAGFQGTFLRHPDGGLVVNRRMQTTGSAAIYAAGDAAAVVWPQAVRRQQWQQRRRRALLAEQLASSATATAAEGDREEEGSPEDDSPPPLWFQMRLWNQARVQALFAARAMAGVLDPLEAADGGAAFEVFAHVTRCLGAKVALLGLYNGQGLGAVYERAVRGMVVTAQGVAAAHERRSDGVAVAAQGIAAAAGANAGGLVAWTVLTGAAAADVAAAAPTPAQVQVQIRVTPGVEYVKVVLLRGRVVGAMLVGDTDLEETMENLILNQLPVTASSATRRGLGGGEVLLDLLDPGVDLEDFFD